MVQVLAISQFGVRGLFEGTESHHRLSFSLTSAGKRRLPTRTAEYWLAIDLAARSADRNYVIWEGGEPLRLSFIAGNKAKNANFTTSGIL
jgi:hypothetical protein